jgi:hypothetical protein
MIVTSIFLKFLKINAKTCFYRGALTGFSGIEIIILMSIVFDML